MAVLALLLAAPFQRGRDCDVCPVDCPMHSPQRAAGKPGCHHGASRPAAQAPDAHGACAMRSACGQHGEAVTPVFHTDLPPAVIAAERVLLDFVAAPERPLRATDAAAPPHRPPEPSVVRSI
jgi:hypothetical protein